MKKFISVLLSALLITSVICSAPYVVSAAKSDEEIPVAASYDKEYSIAAYDENNYQLEYSTEPTEYSYVEPTTSYYVEPTTEPSYDTGTTGDCTWKLDDNGTLTISGNGEMSDYSHYVSEDVTTAPWGSYNPWNHKVNNVIIENGVTNIGNDAFRGCTSLTSVTIPDSVTSIGWDAFYYCSKESVIICNPGSAAERYAVSAQIKISYPEFAYNILEDGTAEVDQYLGSSTNIVIPSTYKGKPVTSIKNWIFANNKIIQSVTIPDSVTKIGKGAFYNCVELKTVTMGNNVTEIGANAFEKCLYLESINLSDNLQTIGDEAFYDCRRLKKLDIPATVTSIGEEAFTNCRSLTNLTIPKGVDKIGDESSLGYGMFENCQNLTEVTIPKNVSYIQINAFDGCKKLTILGSSNSYAKSYAENNNIKFRAIAEDMPIGDANGDNNVDVLDAAAIQKHASGISELNSDQLVAADVNGDGNVDVLDAAEIQKFAAGKIMEFKKKA